MQAGNWHQKSGWLHHCWLSTPPPFTFSHQGNCYVTGVQGKRQYDKGGATRGRCPFLSQSLPSFKHRYQRNISNEGPDLLHNPYFRLTWILMLWTQGPPKPGIRSPEYWEVKRQKPQTRTYHLFFSYFGVCSSLRGSCLPLTSLKSSQS